MDKLENNLSAKEYRRFTVCMAVGAVISVIFVVLFSQVITRITARMTYDTALAVKETMLKENVENLIAYLDVCADAYQEENPEATAADVEEEVRQIAYRKIYSEIHADGTYMWVQKVLNYDGGDDYAIRLIIRWGGDEFVAILYGIEPKDQPLAGDRILESIRSIELK